MDSSFSNVCCFTNLKREAEKLEYAIEDLQARVDAAKKNIQVILPYVSSWLRDANYNKNHANEILNQTSNLQIGCLTHSARSNLSKKAKKTTDAIRELQQEFNNFGSTISHPPPIAATSLVQLGTTAYDFESRRQIEDRILTTLNSKGVNMVGIYGVRGVGKTTMAVKIMNRALKEKLFDEVVIAFVSQPVDKLGIQLQISEPLGLKLEHKTLTVRAGKLRLRLIAEKRTLIVLDDVREELILHEMGIPCEDGCKILMTSRNRDVVSAMNAKVVGEVRVLTEEESWFLFREKAGACVENGTFKSIAKEVVKECNGLPIALASLGVKLRNKSMPTWNDALWSLRNSNPYV